MNARLALVAAKYLCQHGSVGLYRLVDDLLRDAGLLPVFAELGAVEVVGGAPMAPRPGTPEWWRAYSAVKDAVLYLEAKGVAKYLPQLEVVNWMGAPCGSPAPAGGGAKNSRGVQKGGGRRATIDAWL